jgi:hypothetical protein
VQNLFSRLLQTAEKVIGVQLGAVPAAIAAGAAVGSAVANSATANAAAKNADISGTNHINAIA